MYKRNIFNKLDQWKKKENRKPLLLRGARQVGKTSAIKLYAEKNFKNFIYLNLEKAEHQNFFYSVGNVEDILQSLELAFNIKVTEGDTLLFIDEIQNSSIALQNLRFFYEEKPNLHVIAAGSLLEVYFKHTGFSIPAGRVEYLYLHPLSFDEFLGALSLDDLNQKINNFNLKTKIPIGVHNEILKKYIIYANIGGMPEIVNKFLAKQNLFDLQAVYESLLTGFSDDLTKYSNLAQVPYLKHVLENVPYYVGQQIAYNNFANSSFRSREISRAFFTLESAMLLQRVFSSRSLSLPIVNNQRKSPKLLFLDIGLVNFKVGFRSKFDNFFELENNYQGQLTEQLVGQSLIAHDNDHYTKLNYWYRDKKNSEAEIDYLINFKGQVLPIEVKSGKSGSLKSLQVFIDETKNDIAVRVYSGNLAIENLTTPNGKRFKLYSVPFYLCHRLRELLDEV